MKFLVEDNNCDMHLHSTFSDGNEDISDLINLCIDEKLTTISITDHDTMRGYMRLDKRSIKKLGVNLISGVEMGCVYHGKMVHALAYGINPYLFHILKSVYYKYYPGFKHKHITLENAYKITHILKGKLILAHPYKYKREDFKGVELVEAAIKDHLVDGIECLHSYHNEKEIETLIQYADKNDLYISAGSDFHYFGKKVRDDISSYNVGRLEVIGKKIYEELEAIKNKKSR